MTKEEILAMKAGQELDRLVATEVMGEPIPEFIPPNALELQLAGSPVKSPQGNWLSRCKYSEGDIPTWRPLPFSTDISAAWQVVEKMTDEGWYWYGYSVGGSLRLSASQFTKEIPEDLPELESKIDKGIVDGDFGMPEAICKAALLAKLEVKEK